MSKYRVLLAFFILIILSCCSRGRNGGAPEARNLVEWEFASGIDVDVHEHYTVAAVKNPWKQGAVLQIYILVDRDKPLPDSLPEGTVVRVPLRNCLVYSSVHCNVIKELTGSFDAVGGVCDAQYYNTPEIVAGINDGRIADCGNSMAPTIEKVMMLKPEAILLSPFQNSGYGALTATGIPIIECADYMEPLPLGRAEWIKFFGLLFGNTECADSMFQDVKEKYTSLAAKAATADNKPKVLTETITNGVWYVPGGNSYMARMIADAGGDFPWKDTQSVGSIPLDYPKVFEKAYDADVWLIKAYLNDATLADIKAIDTRNARFKAFSNGGIYYCNTSKTTLYDDFPFHPDKLLEEYIKIFHPGLLAASNLQYFKKIEK